MIACGQRSVLTQGLPGEALCSALALNGHGYCLWDSFPAATCGNVSGAHSGAQIEHPSANRNAIVLTPPLLLLGIKMTNASNIL